MLMRYTPLMVYWETPRTRAGLLDAVKQHLDLPEEEWDKLYKAATPYQRRCADLIRDPSIAPHGTENTYVNYGCRCGDCTEAASHERERRRQQRVQQDFNDAPPDATSAKAYEDMTPLEKALHMREQGFDLSPKAQALLDAHERSGGDAAGVI